MAPAVQKDAAAVQRSTTVWPEHKKVSQQLPHPRRNPTRNTFDATRNPVIRAPQRPLPPLPHHHNHNHNNSNNSNQQPPC